MKGIKVCPHCGNDRITVKHKFVCDRSVIRTARFSAQCTKCHARGPVITGAYRQSWVCDVPKWAGEYKDIKHWENEAVRLWNKRRDE